MTGRATGPGRPLLDGLLTLLALDKGRDERDCGFRRASEDGFVFSEFDLSMGLDGCVLLPAAAAVEVRGAFCGSLRRSPSGLRFGSVFARGRGLAVVVGEGADFWPVI